MRLFVADLQHNGGPRQVGGEGPDQGQGGAAGGEAGAENGQRQEGSQEVTMAANSNLMEALSTLSY